MNQDVEKTLENMQILGMVYNIYNKEFEQVNPLIFYHTAHTI